MNRGAGYQRIFNKVVVINMKICFFLQRRFSYIGHELAKILKERHQDLEFCGYTTLRTSFDFLKNQKDIQYTKLLLEEDVYKQYQNEKIDREYLDKIEKEYGLPNLWPYLDVDRILSHNLLLREYPYDRYLYSHEDLVKIFQVNVRAVINFLESEKPDYLIFSVVGSLTSLLLYQVAKKKNIKTLIIEAGRIGNKYFITEEYDRPTYILKSLEYIKEHSAESSVVKYLKEAEKFLKHFREKKNYYYEASESFEALTRTPSRWKNLEFLLPMNLLRFARWLIRYFPEYWKCRDDFSTPNPFYVYWDKLKRKLRIAVGCEDLYDKVISGEKYVYFPLQSEPEALPMLLTPFYADQLWLIKQVAKSLPLQYKLYVKDHPWMIGYRPRRYYREIKKIPNVKLIDVSANGIDLIQNSRAVIGIPGTSGWEGLKLRKPVIVFGKIFYSYLSAVKRCSNVEDLPYLFKDLLEKPVPDCDKEIVQFIAALFRESVDVDFWQLWDFEGGGKLAERKGQLVPLVDLLSQKMGLR